MPFVERIFHDWIERLIEFSFFLNCWSLSLDIHFCSFSFSFLLPFSFSFSFSLSALLFLSFSIHPLLSLFSISILFNALKFYYQFSIFCISFSCCRQLRSLEKKKQGVFYSIVNCCNPMLFFILLPTSHRRLKFHHVFSQLPFIFICFLSH